MTLGDLIKMLKQYLPSVTINNGFHNPHSYRGYYECLAFEPKKLVTVGDMLRDAEDSLGKKFTGYKGGTYTMCEYTDVYLSNYGTTGDELSSRLMEYMLQDTPD